MQQDTQLTRMGFDLSEEQLMIGAAARDFAQRRLAPKAAERDRTGVFPLEEVQEAANLGLLAMKVPAEVGGAGTDNVGFALAMEAIAASCVSTATIVASSNLTAKVLFDHGSEEQRERLLGPFLRGESGPAAFALSEPACGSDAAALTTKARLEGDEWILDGEKMWITSGGHAGVTLVFARTGGPGPKGISCFAVEKDAPGFRIGKHEDKMGQRASGTVALSFEGCRVPAANMIGPRDGGYPIALESLTEGRVGIAAVCVGIAESALAEGLSYAKDRRAFGQRVADFQNSQFAFADSRMNLDAAWLLTLRAAKLVDAGERAAAETSMAKLFASEAASNIVDCMLQLHGGYGYSTEFSIERLYRDVRVTRIYEGTSEVQRLLIARDVLSSG